MPDTPPLKILFVAKHDCGDNDDEGAITHALRELGHYVVTLHERASGDAAVELSKHADLCLFLKWNGWEVIPHLHCPATFWYFDLVDAGEDGLAERTVRRLDWFKRTLRVVPLAFCTDGDFAAKHPDQLVWLMQGMDERHAGRGEPGMHVTGNPDIIFTGIQTHSLQRITHINELHAHYGSRFLAFGNHPRQRRHGRTLSNLFAAVPIVLAPDAPVSDRYWSNRVYLTLGMAGFLLHPYCAGLAEQYEDGTDLVFYRNRKECIDLIDFYLSDAAKRREISEHGYQTTLRKHLYRHRCQDLIRTVRERLKI